MTHICVNKLTIISSDNGLSPGRRQAIIWTNDGILLIGPLGTNISEILSKNSHIFIQENAFQNIICEVAAILSRTQCVKYVRKNMHLYFALDIIIAMCVCMQMLVLFL